LKRTDLKNTSTKLRIIALSCICLVIYFISRLTKSSFPCFSSYAIQNELMLMRRSFLEVSHQLENANEEIRGLSLRLQENVSIFCVQAIHFSDPNISVTCPVTKTESVANLLYSFLFYLISYGCGASKYTHKMFA